MGGFAGFSEEVLEAGLEMHIYASIGTGRERENVCLLWLLGLGTSTQVLLLAVDACAFVVRLTLGK